MTPTDFFSAADEPLSGSPASEAAPYIETIAEFLDTPDAPVEYIIPDLLPSGVIMLVHGEPRARKSLVAFELALSAATGTAPFGLARFQPSSKHPVLYVQQEDPRSLTKQRLRRLVQERCSSAFPDLLHVSIRRGIDLDDPAWVDRLLADLRRLDIKLLVLDAARRLSAKTDEGPAKVRELTAILRRLITEAGVTLVLAHHDVKPPQAGPDQRRRGQRASGGDWFAVSECPVFVERLSATESLVYPEDYKFDSDPAPFTFASLLDGRLISRLVGTDTTPDAAETAGQRGKLLVWIRTNGPTTKSDMKRAGFRWDMLHREIPTLQGAGLIDAIPGRKQGTWRYFVPDTEESRTVQPEKNEK